MKKLWPSLKYVMKCILKKLCYALMAILVMASLLGVLHLILSTFPFLALVLILAVVIWLLKPIVSWLICPRP
jgi:hypothetical protein